MMSLKLFLAFLFSGVPPPKNAFLFKTESGYGKLWGGRDATFALAMMSLNPEDASNLTWTWEELPHDNRISLKSWRDHFAKKYPVVGVMKEYDGWDFEKKLSSLPEKEGEEASGGG